MKIKSAQRFLVFVAMSFLTLCFSWAVSAAQTQSGVFPDRSTPENAVKLLIVNANVLQANFEALEFRRTNAQSLYYPQPDEAERRRVERAKRVVLEGLDLSSIPEWSRETAGIETVFMLSELLRRASSQGSIEFMPFGSNTWTIKGTHVQLTRLTGGMRAGDVVFSAESVSNIPFQYSEAIAEAPIVGFDAYRYFTETPGGIFPPKWAGIVLSLPEFWRISIGSNTVWQWVFFVFALIAVFALPLCAFLMSGSIAFRTLFGSLLGAALSWFGQEFAIKEASFTGSAGIIGAGMFSIVYFTSLATLAFLMVEGVSGGLIRLAVGEKDSAASGFAKLLFRILGVAAACAVALYGLSIAGIPVVGIVAGLGVGGLAVALAAKTTLENLLACFVLYIDKSVQVGDTIETKELSGMIEHIGMRSIRVRAESGDVTTITNSKFADLTITKKVASLLSPR